jgi:hypothetical protein
MPEWGQRIAERGWCAGRIKKPVKRRDSVRWNSVSSILRFRENIVVGLIFRQGTPIRLSLANLRWLLQTHAGLHSVAR